MDLRHKERILRVFRHHPTPFLYRMFALFFVVGPAFFLLYIARGLMSDMVFFLVNVLVIMIILFAFIYVFLVYWLDKLVVTNQRIIFVYWKYLTLRKEYEARLDDIQDIVTSEKGLLAYFYIFDYGTFKLSTASAKITITFHNAPDPEGIRNFVYSLKPQ
ncbi:hypothetical protein CVV38_02850 [Candidatus Peregrinibacteria bacterium HGW-Peregrinibacteria-1]|jgi:hypothetical protein|nr:MAG: hypothetical protein CVV38_02850 [Candidatus Peregrinibacteria bacterium HGW-Peregrinibacteria-1]